MTCTPTESLTVVAQSVESLHPEGAPPAWAEIVGDPHKPEGLRWHPDLDTLLGYRAPPECNAIVTVGGGWAHPLDGPGESILAPGERRRCKTVFLLSRAGECIGFVRAGSTVLVNEPPSAGRIVDLVHRALGLATVPPDENTDRLLARVWLSTVVAVGRRATGPLSWPEVVAQHPVVKAMFDLGLGQPPPEELLACLRVGSEAWSWNRLAQQAAEPGWLADLLPPGAGGWFDEGVLSRWLLAFTPEVDKLIRDATPVITKAAARKLGLVLRQLDVVRHRHPGWSGIPNT
ncbi:MAG: hypothetical protein ACRDZ8_03180 [Acidimicrobiales bacterium]